MRRLEFTPRARHDIEEIWEYSFERFGLDEAQAYLRGIQRAAMTVTEDPRRGLACDEIRSGYRKFFVGFDCPSPLTPKYRRNRRRGRDPDNVSPAR
jgi:toxin ParE1/3/4